MKKRVLVIISIVLTVIFIGGMAALVLPVAMEANRVMNPTITPEMRRHIPPGFVEAAGKLTIVNEDDEKRTLFFVSFRRPGSVDEAVAALKASCLELQKIEPRRRDQMAILELDLRRTVMVMPAVPFPLLEGDGTTHTDITFSVSRTDRAPRKEGS